VESYPSPLGFESSDIILMKGFCSLISYNLKSCSFNVRNVGINISHTNEIFPYQSDSEPLHLKSYWKKEQLSTRVIGGRKEQSRVTEGRKELLFTRVIGRKNNYLEFFGCLASFFVIVYIILSLR
jgi:hypothetical protein